MPVARSVLRGSTEHGFGAAVFSVGLSSQTLTRAWSARGRSAGFRGQLWRVYPSVFRGRRAVAVLREASRPNRLIYSHRLVETLEGSRGTRPSSSVKRAVGKTLGMRASRLATTVELALASLRRGLAHKSVQSHGKRPPSRDHVGFPIVFGWGFLSDTYPDVS
jgi:hypothetical protein